MNITVYTGASCPGCAATERALTKAGISYVTKTPTESDIEWFRALGHRSYPVVIVKSGETVLDQWHGFRPDKISALEVPS